MLRFLTAGESHGAAVTAILEGMPAGLPLAAEDIDRDLAARIADHLASADCPQHWIDFLEPQTLETAEDQARILGDTLPLGLTLLD